MPPNSHGLEIRRFSTVNASGLIYRVIYWVSLAFLNNSVANSYSIIAGPSGSVEKEPRRNKKSPGSRNLLCSTKAFNFKDVCKTSPIFKSVNIVLGLCS